MATTPSRDAGSLRLDIDGIQRLAGRHEQSIPLCAAEADVGAVFGKANDPDRDTVGRDDLNARARTRPQISIGIATHAVCAGRARRRSRYCQLRMTPSVAHARAVNVVGTNLTAGPGVGDVQDLVIGR